MALENAWQRIVSALRRCSRPQLLIAALDQQPLAGGAVVALLLIAAAFAYLFLGHYPVLTMLRPVVTGPEAGKYSVHGWPRLSAWHLIGRCMFAGMVGVVGAAAVRRLKWLIAPCTLLVVSAATVLAISYPGAARPIYRGSSTLIHYQFDLTATGALSMGAVLACAAIAGALSPRLTRRVPLSLITASAVAWVVVSVLSGLLGLWLTALGSSADSALGDLAYKAHEILPYVVGGGLMVWLLRRPSLWTAALIVALLPAFLLLSGFVRMWTAGAPWHNALNEASWVVTALASAAVGAWLAEAAMSLRLWRDLAGHALAVVAIIIIAVGVASWREWASAIGGSRNHTFSAGLSAGIEPPVKDGEIVLLKKGNAIGVVIPRKQTTQPERISYDWCYRTDGGGTFHAQEGGKFRSGHVAQAKRVRFGPFSVSWSGHDDGSGYLYYDRFAGSPITPNDVRICVTHERDLERINAYDPRRLFKGSPSDPGMRLAPPAGLTPKSSDAAS